MEIELGEGNVFVSNIYDEDGRHGITFHTQDESRPINSRQPEKEVSRESADAIIWCSNVESARVLQDQVSVIVLGLNGRAVKDVVSLRGLDSRMEYCCKQIIQSCYLSHGRFASTWVEDVSSQDFIFDKGPGIDSNRCHSSDYVEAVDELVDRGFINLFMQHELGNESRREYLMTKLGMQRFVAHADHLESYFKEIKETIKRNEITMYKFPKIAQFANIVKLTKTRHDFVKVVDGSPVLRAYLSIPYNQIRRYCKIAWNQRIRSLRCRFEYDYAV